MTRHPSRNLRRSLSAAAALGLAVLSLPGPPVRAAEPAKPSALAQVAIPAPANPASRFNGTWMKDNTSRLRFSENPPLLPAALEKFKSLRPQDDPGARCTEAGLGRMMINPSPIQIVALENHLLLVAENLHSVRRIWTDLKAHSDDIDPGFYGESIVKWEGDTMVVDTIGLNGQNYLDSWGYPMSDQMHVVERWRMLDPNKLQIEYTFDDPKNYSKPWSSTFTYSRRQDFRLGEYSCTENNRNNPDDKNNPTEWTSTDAPAQYQERPAAAGR